MATNQLIPIYPFDPSGTLISNKIINEQQIITVANYRDYHFIVPNLSPYFSNSLKVTYKSLANEIRILVEGIDYYCTHWFISASRACSSPIYGSISFLDLQLSGTISLQYQTLGGIWVIDQVAVANILADRLHNPRITSWDVVTDQPISFPIIDHIWDLADLVGAKDIVSELTSIELAIRQSQINGFAAHTAASNPHHTTANEVGAYSKAEIDAMFATHIANSYSF